MENKISPQKNLFEQAAPFRKYRNIFSLIGVIVSLGGVIVEYFYGTYDNVSYAITSITILNLLCLYYFDRRYVCLYTQAEETRRDGLMDNAFDSHLASVGSYGYYDTEGLSPGVKKLLATIHQNSHETNGIVARMFEKQERKTLILAVVLLVAACISAIMSSGFLAGLQLFLSANFLGDYLKLKDLQSTATKVEETCQRIWESISNGMKDSPKLEAQIVREAIRYETALSRAGIAVDSDIYRALNDKLTNEWILIKNRYNIDAITNNSDSQTSITPQR